VSVALLVDLAWKSGAVAALVLAGTALLRGRPAAERVALLRVGVVIILALPLLSALSPALTVQAPVAAPSLKPATALEIAAPRPASAAPTVSTPGPRPVTPSHVAPPATPRLSPILLLTTAWLVGVGVLGLRLICGVGTLALWTRRAQPVVDQAWRASLDRAAIGVGRPQLKTSSSIASPLSWRWGPGVILIDEATLARPERADAVLTHEMGHVRRHDWMFLMLSQALVAALWFNPLIWLLQRELALQSEYAADDWASRRIGRLDYAGVLVALARRPQPHAALGMAGPTSDLARRVRAVLETPVGKGRPWATALTVAACLGLAGPLAALEWAAPAALPTALRPTDARPAPRPGPATAAAVVALLPKALTPSPATRPAADLSPDARAILIRQRDRGLAMFEAGARAIEASALQIRRQANRLSEPDERADMLSEADDLMVEAQALRKEARELAARDVATLKPMTEAEEREMAIELQNLLGLPTQLGLPMDIPVNVDGAPSPPREDIAAAHRDGARQLRIEAARMEAEALQVEQDRFVSREAANDQAGSFRGQALNLRRQADDLDQQAADVMSG
jgi:beta-lactamase regulating signal transducer with metallopeptidase domain